MMFYFPHCLGGLLLRCGLAHVEHRPFTILMELSMGTFPRPDQTILCPATTMLSSSLSTDLFSNIALST